MRAMTGSSEEQAVIRNLTEAIAAQLRAERGAAHLTTLGLAKRSGVPERTLMRILGSEREITASQIDKLAKALGITAADLVSAAQARLDKAIAARNAAALKALEDQAVTRLTESDTPSSEIHPNDTP